jgi:hypothetical protein
MDTQMNKLAQAGDTYADLVEFLDWIDHHPDLCLARWHKIEPVLVPLSRSYEAIIYEYLEIDAQALKKERRALLESLRQQVEP